MSNKNPYEKQQELDIPDFVEDKTNSDSSIDMSIFKMSDDELYDDVTEENETYEDDYDDYEPRRKKKKGNASIVICIILILLLLLALAGAAFYALKQHEAYVKANTAYLQMQANEDNYKKQIAEQSATIADLEKKIEELQRNDGSIGEGDIVYEITDGGMRFRVEPTSDAELTTYNGYSQVETGERYRVLEVVNDKDLGDEYLWAKLADNVYFCLGSDSDNWVKRID